MDVRRVLRSRWIVLFLVALGVRLVLWGAFAFADANRSLEGDGFGYYTLSRNLSTAYGGARSQLSELALHRPPVYPVAVAGFLAVGRSLRWALFLQCFIGAGVAVLTFLLARKVLSDKWAMFAGLLVALDPVSVFHSNLLLTETLFAALMTGTAIALLRTIERPTLASAAAAGGLLGVATLTRPVTLYLPLVLVPLLLWRTNGRLKWRALCAAALVVTFLIPVGSWAVRNRVVEGGLVVTTIDGYTMLQYRGRGALGAEIGMDKARQRVTQIEASYPSGLSAYQLSRREFSDGLELMTKHPRGAIQEYVKGFARTWTGTGTGQLAKLVPSADRGIVDLLLFVPLGAMLVLAAFGVPQLWRIDRDVFWLLVCLIGYLSILSASTETYNRFRVPIVPFVAVFAAVGASWLFRTLASGQRHPRRRRNAWKTGPPPGEEPPVADGP